MQRHLAPKDILHFKLKMLILHNHIYIRHIQTKETPSCYYEQTVAGRA